MVPTRRQWMALVGAMSFLGFAIGLMGGVEWAKPSRPAATSVDVGFLQDMSSHHEQAIQMSLLEMRRGQDPTARSFAEEIHYLQAYEIGAMERQLDEWGYSRQNRSSLAMTWMRDDTPVDQMPGLASTAEVDKLATVNGAAADALFIRLMQDHHRGGIAMADYAAKNAKNAFVREIAARMARVQRLEINEMDGALKRAGLDPNPPGWTPGPFGMNHGGTDH